jgi:phage tail sheath gpL-like
MPNFQIVGFASSDRTPGFVGQVKTGGGGASAADLPVPVVLVGTKTAAGTAVPDVDVLQLFAPEDADTFFGPGSELARMAYAALLYPGVVLYGAPVAEAGGAVAATVAVTFANNATSAGTYRFRVDGVAFEVGVANGDTPNAVAVAVHNAINSLPRLSASSLVSPPAAVWTATRKSKGARGNQGTFVLDATLGPTGMTATVTTGTAMSGVGRFRFTGGTGTEVPTNVITALTPRDDRFAALAQNDQTNLVGAGLWRDWSSTKNGPLEGRPTMTTVANNDAAQPTALATAINDPMFALCWQKNGESHPSEVAASVAAMRAVNFAADPGFNTAGRDVLGIMAQVNPADRFARPLLNSCFNNGITPINTTNDFRSVVVRGCTTKSFTGTAPDYSTFDWADIQVPQYIRLDLGLFWTTVFQPNNPRNASDPATGQQERPVGVATPGIWNKTVYSKLKGYERGVNGSPPLIIDVDQLQPVSTYDFAAKRIMSLVPVRVCPGDYQVGVTISQTT